MERLNISRGNASMMVLRGRYATGASFAGCTQARRAARILRESRRRVGECFSLIAAERKRREMDPVLETIRQCQQMLGEAALGQGRGQAGTRFNSPRQRLAGMEEFMEVTNKIFQQFIGNARSGLTKGGEGVVEGVLRGEKRVVRSQ